MTRETLLAAVMFALLASSTAQRPIACAAGAVYGIASFELRKITRTAGW